MNLTDFSLGEANLYNTWGIKALALPTGICAPTGISEIPQAPKRKLKKRKGGDPRHPWMRPGGPMPWYRRVGYCRSEPT